MKKTFKELWRVIPMVLVLMTILASCANNTSTPSDTTTATDNAVATDAVTTEPVVDYYKNIPDDLRFDNYTFKILTYDGNTWNTYLDCDQILGSTLNDAAFTRNLEVCEKFGISIEVTKLPHAQIIKEIQVMNQAGGSDSYDLVCFWATTNLASLLTTNDLYDWQDIEYVGLEEDWFNQTANKAFNIVGRQLFAVSDLTYPIQQNFRVLCNLNAVANAGLEPPYSHVYNGTWTYETFYEYIANRYVDNNNDGKQDEGDTYGLDSNINPVSRFINNWGESPITIGENSFVLNLYSERLTDMLTKMNKLLYDGDCYQGGSSNNYKVFFSGRAMFNIFSSDPALLINIDSFKFGNLPYPKYDESQEDFITVTHGGLMAVPSGNSNPDRAGAIIEALSAASNKYVEDAFIESYIEGRILQDEDSVKMYRIMRDTSFYETCRNIDPSGYFTALKYYTELMSNNDSNLYSRYSSLQRSIKRLYDDLYANLSARQN